MTEVGSGAPHSEIDGVSTDVVDTPGPADERTVKGPGVFLPSADLADIPDYLQGRFAKMRIEVDRLRRILAGRTVTLELLESEVSRLRDMLGDQRDYASRLLARARTAEASLHEIQGSVAHE